MRAPVAQGPRPGTGGAESDDLDPRVDGPPSGTYDSRFAESRPPRPLRASASTAGSSSRPSPDSLGRALASAAVGAVVALGPLSVPGLSLALQRHRNELGRPLLVLVGRYLLELTRPGLSPTSGIDGLRKKAAEGGTWDAALPGALFALSLCPVSATLFFGNRVPLSLRRPGVRWSRRRSRERPS